MTSNDAADAEDVPSTKLPTSEGEAKRPNNLNDEVVPETIEISIKCLKQKFAYAMNKKGQQVRLSVGELLPIKGLWFVVVAMATDGRLVLQRRQ